MNQLSAFQSALWQRRWQRLRLQLRGAFPFATGVLAAFAALLVYNLLFPPPPPLTSAEVSDSITQAIASVTPAPAYSASVYQTILPSFVLIQVHGEDTDGEETNGVGSGVIVDDRGAILTSLHVVAEASAITLTFADGSKSGAQVMVTQPENDIAVLQATQPPSELPPATLGNPNTMRIGDEAFVVGNPLGLYGSMSAGVISGFDRSYRPPNTAKRLEGLIQFDAAVNPGNSGGPLLNRNGQVVGIVTGLVNPTEENVFIGIGFAVPISVAGGAAGLPPY
jgi:S1-C subfamily serine protease